MFCSKILADQDLVLIFILPSTVNLAINKKATQSSIAHNGLATRAVDGNRDGVWSGGSCTHCGYSNSGINEWWRVDLGTSVQVTEVSVFSRTHHLHGLRLWNTLFELRIGKGKKQITNNDNIFL
jgi:hypothetical protein